MAERELSEADVDVLRRSRRDLRWRGTSRVVKKLSAGASGSSVFLLDVNGERAVLKVTEDPDWHERADREFAVYDKLAEPLGEALPTVLAAHHDGQAVRLLLRAHRSLPSALRLDRPSWIAIADQLGRVQGVRILAAGWLEPRPWPSLEEFAAAIRIWSDHGSAVPAARAAERLAEAGNRQSFTDHVLTHGDCHVGNLLQGPDGRVMWIDWQEVCLSGGLDDLVFLWQRAEFDGAQPPREAMSAAYAAARRLPLDEAFRSAIAACELRLLLVAWPHFLRYGRQDRQRAMADRLDQLATGLDT